MGSSAHGLLGWIGVAGIAVLGAMGCSGESGERDSTIAIIRPGPAGGLATDGTQLFWAYSTILERRDLQGEGLRAIANGPGRMGGVIADEDAVYYVRGFYDRSSPAEDTEKNSDLIRYDKAAGTTKVLASSPTAISFVALFKGFLFFASDTSLTTNLINTEGEVRVVDARGDTPDRLFRSLGWQVSCQGLVATEDALWILSKGTGAEPELTQVTADLQATSQPLAFPNECLEKSVLAALSEPTDAITGAATRCWLTRDHLFWSHDATSGNGEENICDGGELRVLDRASGVAKLVSVDGCSPRYAVSTPEAIWWVDDRSLIDGPVELRFSARP